MSIQKLALRRDPSVPVGQPAPMHIQCFCGNKIDVTPGHDGAYTCPCGHAFDEHGWVLDRPDTETETPKEFSTWGPESPDGHARLQAAKEATKDVS